MQEYGRLRLGGLKGRWVGWVSRGESWQAQRHPHFQSPIFASQTSPFVTAQSWIFHLIKTKPSGAVAFPRFESIRGTFCDGGQEAVIFDCFSCRVCCVRAIQCVDSNDSMISVCVFVFSMLKFVGVAVSLRIGCVVSCCDVQCLQHMSRHLFCKLSSPSCVICFFQRNVLPVFA